MEGGGRDPFNFGGPFGGFRGGSFGGFRGGSFGGFGGPNDPPSLMSNFFGGRNPFDDPFFNQPLTNADRMFQPGGYCSPSFFCANRSPLMPHPPGFLENYQPPGPSRSRGPVIEEIDSDDEKEGDGQGQGDKEKKGCLGKHGRSSSEEEAEDDTMEERRNRQMENMNAERRNRQMQNMYLNDMVNDGYWQPQTGSYSFQSSTVTYGGQNGNYFTSSKTRRTGSDGLTLEESREANTATREAAHKISRGLHNKGHTVARRLNSDGHVDTMQTLHNINEDELADFEQSWSGNAGMQMQLPGRPGSFGSGLVNREQQMLLPSTDPSPPDAPAESSEEQELR